MFGSKTRSRIKKLEIELSNQAKEIKALKKEVFISNFRLYNKPKYERGKPYDDLICTGVSISYTSDYNIQKCKYEYHFTNIKNGEVSTKYD